MITRLAIIQFGALSVTVCHGLNRCGRGLFAAGGDCRVHIPLERLLQADPAVKVVGGQNLADPAVEPLHHAVGLRRLRLGQPVFGAQGLTKLVELMGPGGLPRPGAKQPVGELLAVIGQVGPNTDRTHLLQVAPEATCGCRTLIIAELDVDPAGGVVDGHKQVPPVVFIDHLREVFDVHMEIPRLISLERLGGGLGQRCRGQPREPVAFQRPVDRRARGLLTDELTSDRQQVLEPQPQSLAHGHHHRFLCRRHGRLQPMRSERTVLRRLPSAPAADGALGDPNLPGHLPDRLVRRLYGRPSGRSRGGVLVQSYLHQAWPHSSSTNSCITAPRANNARRVRSMQLSGT